MPVTKGPVAEQFGARLRRARWRAGLSQEALGLEASIHRTEIGLLERAARVPRIDTVIALAEALSIQPGELLDGIRLESDGDRPTRRVA